MKKEPYCCIRCGYNTVQKNHIYKHLYLLKKTCPATKNLIELTDEIKQHILDNRIYKEPKTNQALSLELQFYKNRKNEAFYQMLLEQFLGGGHKHLSCGITDVTTDECHAEIKEWKNWKEAIGQLGCYNKVDPRNRLELYFFGSISKKAKKEAIDVSKSFEYHVFEFIDENNEIKIIDLSSGNVVHVYKPS